MIVLQMRTQTQEATSFHSSVWEVSCFLFFLKIARVRLVNGEITFGCSLISSVDVRYNELNIAQEKQMLQLQTNSLFFFSFILLTQSPDAVSHTEAGLIGV